MNNENYLIIPKQIVTADRNDSVLKNHAVEIENGRILRIAEIDNFNNFEGRVYRYENYTLIPGFVQTHIHLCQTLFRGLAEDMELLDWLQQRIFPFENAHSQESIRISAQLGLHELQTSGTTTFMDMGTINHQPVIFEEITRSKIRAFAGKCMMDINELYPTFKEDTQESLQESYNLAKEYHNSVSGRIKYAFAPRFVLSCSEELLIKTEEMLGDFEGALYHTHSSENLNEIEEVRRMHGTENIEYFDKIGVANEKTVLAHCIHLNDREIEILRDKKVRVAHCPSANFKLGSGIADIPRYIDEGIHVSLGADGAPCNNNLNAFVEMRLAALMQKPRYNPTVMDTKKVFRMATIDGAKALHIDDEVGSIEVGKKADLVLLDLEQSNQSLLDEEENIYSDIVYTSGSQNVKEVIVEGDWVVDNGQSKIFNKEEISIIGKEELKKLLKRI
jgi:cytosine/adenosine deaminase-related metal-dependent hydrolase